MALDPFREQPLPERLLRQTGQIHTVERPSQGLYYDVSILTAERGRFILKVARQQHLVDELAREFSVLRGLQAHSPFVPAPIDQAVVDGTGFYLFTCLEGDNLLDALSAGSPTARHRLLAGFAGALRRVHTWTPGVPRPAEWCGGALAQARSNVATGRVPDPIRSRSQFRGARVCDVLAVVEAGCAAVTPEIVYTHGDYALTNALVHDGEVIGVIDWSAGGWRDRRIDLAQAVKSIRHNLGDEGYVDTFLGAYRYPAPVDSLRLFEALDALL